LRVELREGVNAGVFN